MTALSVELTSVTAAPIPIKNAKKDNLGKRKLSKPVWSKTV